MSEPGERNKCSLQDQISTPGGEREFVSVWLLLQQDATGRQGTLIPEEAEDHDRESTTHLSLF